MVNARKQLPTSRVMLHVIGALIPGTVIHAWLGGWFSLIVLTTSLVAAVVTELACTRSWREITDGSAVVTGLLIALCLPASTPWYVAAIAVLIAIALAKHAFGGLGHNVFNPAMAGYCAVLLAYPALVVEFDTVSGATALDQLAHRGATTIDELHKSTAFGHFGAAKHEWLNVAFLIGGLYLIAMRLIPWLLPTCVLVGMGVVSFVLDDGGSSASHGSPLFNWFAGGTMLAAFFIATDPVTSPSNRNGMVIYALSLGAIAMLIRKYSSWPDGLAFAVLILNCFVPLLEQLPRKPMPST